MSYNGTYIINLTFWSMKFKLKFNCYKNNNKFIMKKYRDFFLHCTIYVSKNRIYRKYLIIEMKFFEKALFENRL